jgi:hypothetical protein
MSFATGFSDVHMLMVEVADLSYRSPASKGYHSNFTAGQDKMGIFALFGADTGNGTGGADDFAALTGIHFDIMNFDAGGNSSQRHAITDFRLDAGAAFDGSTDFQSQGGQNIAFFAVGVV